MDANLQSDLPAEDKDDAQERTVKKRAFQLILSLMCLEAICVGLMFPSLPRLVLDLSGGKTAAASQALGFIAVGWAFGQFFGSPILGALSDRYGRRPVLLISLLGYSVDLSLMGFAPALAWVFVGRGIAAFTASSYSTASAYIVDITPAEQRSQRFGLLAALNAAGLILGPAIGVLLAQFNFRAPFWAAAALAGLCAICGFFWLPESLSEKNRAPLARSSLNPATSLGILLKSPGLLPLAAVVLIFQMANQGRDGIFVLYTHYRYQWTGTDVGLFLMAFLAGTVLIQAVVTPNIAKRYGERSTILIGLGFAVIGMIGLGLSRSSPEFCAASVLTCLSVVAAPPLMALATMRVTEAEQGRLQGALAALGGLSVSGGMMLFTQIFAKVTVEGEPIGRSGMPFLAGAGLMLGAWFLASMFARIRPSVLAGGSRDVLREDGHLRPPKRTLRAVLCDARRRLNTLRSTNASPHTE